MKAEDLSSRTFEHANQRTPVPELCAEARIVLRRGELHSWKAARIGATIQAREGAVWVTQEGDGRDVILSAGESFRVTRPGRVLVEALRGSAQFGVC